MTVQATSSSLERELEYRKKLTGITNQINAAESIPHILMTLKDKPAPAHPPSWSG